MHGVTSQVQGSKDIREEVDRRDQGQESTKDQSSDVQSNHNALF